MNTKVKCIKDGWTFPFPNDNIKPVKGEIYIATGVLKAYNDLSYYYLEGFQDVYCVDYFIELSDFTIEELVGERELVEV